MTPAIIFDDAKGLLAPLTDLRPAFDVRTGVVTTLERLTRVLNLKVVALFVPEHLAAITRERHRVPVNQRPPARLEVLCINARCVVPPPELAGLRVGQALVEAESNDVIAARVDSSRAQELTTSVPDGLESMTAPARCLMSRPWHVKVFRDAALRLDLSHLVGHGGFDIAPAATRFGDAPLSVHPSASIYPGVTLDLEQGPILIDQHAILRPRVTICGPAYIGEGSTLLEGCVIRPNTSIGPRCKVAGEVAGTIFQGLSNKAHDGHLGDSYVGEWVNLGAGTINSNLLNTYGEVAARAKPGGLEERTGEQFLGAIIGDHVKTAIGTRIMTGAIVNTGVMWAASTPISGCVPAFSWVTDGGTRPYRIDKFLEVALAAMSRRHVAPSDTYSALLRGIHAGAG